MFRALLARLPGQCRVCRRWPGRTLCTACSQRFRTAHARCGRCALPVPAGVAQCSACVLAPPPLDACFAAVDYAYPWSGLLGQFKFGGEPGLAAVLAAQLHATAGVAEVLADATWVVPMPLSRERLRQRGFNQSLLLARALGCPRIAPALLLRPLHRPPQSLLDREDRQRNVDGVFAVDPLRTAQLQGAHVVLVDDVMTSGASLHAAARVLRAAGARHIAALVVARTPP